MTVGRFSESLLATKPLWSIRASDAPALGIPSPGGVLGASPRMMRSVLADVDSNAEEVVEADEEKEEHKERVEENVLSPEIVVETNIDSESEADPALAIIEQPTSNHQTAPLMKLSTSSLVPSQMSNPLPRLSSRLYPLPLLRLLRPLFVDLYLRLMAQRRRSSSSPLHTHWCARRLTSRWRCRCALASVRVQMAVFGWMAVAVAGGDFVLLSCFLFLLSAHSFFSSLNWSFFLSPFFFCTILS